MRKGAIVLAVVGLSAIGGCGLNPLRGEADMTFVLSSAAFTNGKAIPVQYTCEGMDLSPPLTWTGVPEGTQSLALIVDDPDAPGGTWVHWVVFNLPPETTGLMEGTTAETLPAGAQEAYNSWARLGYGGPCPPSGTHRYVHQLYALDTVIQSLPTPSKEGLESVMAGHILAETKLVGKYRKH